jgi:Fur family peroxide stress response transcriptional regulator
MMTSRQFQKLCHRHGLAATYQREIIYQTAMSQKGHPSPEALFVRVRKKIPSISLATVYANLHTFIAKGLLSEVSVHHGPLRVETNQQPHHHLVCLRCRSIADFDDAGVISSGLRRRLPSRFQLQRVVVDVLGICEACSRKRRATSKK